MTKKSQQGTHLAHVLVAALIGMVALPATMTGLFRSIDDDGKQREQSVDLRSAAINDISRVRTARRDYWDAVLQWNALTRIGIQGLIQPNINDAASIAFYLDPENIAAAKAGDTSHSAAEEEVLSDDERAVAEARELYEALSKKYRNLVDGYIDSQNCPASLLTFHRAGLRELCTVLLAERMALHRPNIASRSEELRRKSAGGNAPVRTLKDRLKQMEESLRYEGGTSVRPLMHSGGRPRPR